MNLSLYRTQPERHRQPQTLDRLKKDWTRDRSAGLRHGVVSERIRTVIETFVATFVVTIIDSPPEP